MDSPRSDAGQDEAATPQPPTLINVRAAPLGVAPAATVAAASHTAGTAAAAATMGPAAGPSSPQRVSFATAGPGSEPASRRSSAAKAGGGPQQPTSEALVNEAMRARVAARLGRAAVACDAFTILCRHNSRHLNADSKDLLTAFHCVSEPPMELSRYLERIARHAEAGEEGVLLGLILAGRYSRSTGLLLSALCAHRLCIAAMVLGTKAHMDRFRSNRTVARIGGLRLPELNGLELAVFRGLDFHTIVVIEELEHMLSASAAAVDAYVAGKKDRAIRCCQSAFLGRVAHPMPPPSPTPSPCSHHDEDEPRSASLSRSNSLQSLRSEPASDSRQHHRGGGPHRSVSPQSSQSAAAPVGGASINSSPPSALLSTKKLIRIGTRLDGGLRDPNELTSSMLGISTDQNSRSQIAAAGRFNQRMLNVWHDQLGGSGSRGGLADDDLNHSVFEM